MLEQPPYKGEMIEPKFLTSLRICSRFNRMVLGKQFICIQGRVRLSSCRARSLIRRGVGWFDQLDLLHVE